MSRKFDGSFDVITLQDRTSHNAWCLDDCYENEMHQNVLRKVENITGIPGNNSEYWQLLQYEETQFYGVSCLNILLLAAILFSSETIILYF